jgi:hypothetical protein
MQKNIDEIDFDHHLRWLEKQHEELMELEDEIEPIEFYDNEQDFEIE